MIRNNLAAATALICALAAGAVSAQGYLVTDLGTLGGSYSSATAINNSTQITGSASTASGTDAYLWQAGKLMDLGLNESFGTSISSNAFVAGYYYGSTGTDAFLYANGVLTNLGMLPNFTNGNTASGVNKLGQVVGVATNGTGRGSTYAGWTWQNGVYTNLGKVSAVAINDSSEILINEFNSSGVEVAVILHNGAVVTTIDPAGSFATVGEAINANGDVAGTFQASNGDHAYVYHNGAVTDYGNFGFDNATALAVNIDEVAVGFAAGYNANSTERAFVMMNGQGTNLNNLIDPNAGWLLKVATGINDAGQIVGTGTINGNAHGFLLTPTNSIIAPAIPSIQSGIPGNGTATITWNASLRATSYNVKRSTNSQTFATVATGVTATTYSDHGLINGTSYYYVVSAVNSAGQSPNSASFLVIPNAPPATPVNVTATAGTGQITIRWTQPSSPDFFDNQLYRATSAGGPFSLIATPTTTSYTDSGLTRGQTFYYYVTALNTSGIQSAPSAIVHATSR